MLVILKGDPGDYLPVNVDKSEIKGDQGDQGEPGEMVICDS
jgi:hypothetical protein